MKIYLQLNFCLLIALLFFVGCGKEEATSVENPPTEVTPPTIDPVLLTIEKGDFRIGFYNIENLFDTLDDPENPKDDEFLPNAPKQWTTERYQKKLDNISLVLQGIDFPLLIGLSEVENQKVVEDLVQTDILKGQNYGIVHYDSPDFRGIDVALLYKKADFTILASNSIEVELPASVSQFSTTRDILLVRGTYKNEVIYVFVNHWPSRSGGVNETSGKREFAASILRLEIDNILEIEPDATIIILGDFNDEPSNRSLVEVLNAQTEKPPNTDNQLYNCANAYVGIGQGSYFFGGDWQMLDQGIVSGNLLDEVGDIKVVGYNVFYDEMVLFEHPTDGLRPNRTYGGDEYFGGFSDHLAIFLEVKNL